MSTAQPINIEDRMDALEKEIASISAEKSILLDDENLERETRSHRRVSAEAIDDRVQFLDEASKRCEKELKNLDQHLTEIKVEKAMLRDATEAERQRLLDPHDLMLESVIDDAENEEALEN